MRQLWVLLLFFIFNSAFGQTYEIGLFAGGTNAIGDIGRSAYIFPTGPAVGGLFKWNKSKRYAWRASVIYGNFTADDSKSNERARQQRGFRIENNIFEASAGLEVNFVPYNLHRLGPAFTPYLYTGVTYFRYDFRYFDAGQLQTTNQREGAFAIPMTVGLKGRISYRMVLGAEIGARYTFTDNLDGSNPEGSNFSQFTYGNVFSDDWYVFSGFTLTYAFGRKPCQDCFE